MVNREKVLALRQAGRSLANIAGQLKLSKTTVARIVAASKVKIDKQLPRSHAMYPELDQLPSLKPVSSFPTNVAQAASNPA